jgi:hypothetical protein
MTTIRQQLRNNAVALISLSVAIVALGYNTWRNETTEEQRNVRHAAFRVLESLGELQEIVDARYYYLPFEPGAADRDLTGLMPPPADASGAALHALWLEEFSQLHRLDESGRHSDGARQAERGLTEALDGTRQAVLAVLARLD